MNEAAAVKPHVCTAAECLTEGEGHTYWLHGLQQVPGVTSLLETIGLKEAYDESIPNIAFYRELGTQFHRAAAFLIEGQEVDEGSLHPDLKPRLDCFREFLAKESPSFVETETVVLGSYPIVFAGRIDARSGNPDYRERSDPIWEFKSGATERWHRFQAWLYQIAVCDCDEWAYYSTAGIVPRVLYVRPKNVRKKYSIVECTQEDFDIVTGALHYFHYKGVV